MPVDQAMRDRLRHDLDATLFVEAGAGSGKTEQMTARIVELVAKGRVSMETLVAITFTEKAAAELRDRIRHHLELAADSASDRPDGERQRCQAALNDIDLAAIQTIHAFAGALLHLFPLEAGLPPGFIVWDELQRDRAFNERFRRWLYDEVPADPSADLYRAVGQMFELGFRPEQLRALAARLQDNDDLLRADSAWDRGSPPDAARAARETGQALLALPDLLALAHHPETDPLVQEVIRVRLTAERLAAAHDEGEALQALCRYEERPATAAKGNQTDWDADGDGNGAMRIKAAFREAKTRMEDVLAAHRTAALARLLEHLRDFTLRYAQERKLQGVATFHDLLTWARDLLRDQPDVRRRAGQRFQRVLVDEFQDTDPLQVEITWFLAGEPRQADQRDWRRVGLTPGKLFAVGDPKQSIYRFRRADVGIFEDVYGLLAEEERTQLTQNFRSTAPVLSWVNFELGRDMQHQPGVSPAYRELAARPEETTAGGVYWAGALADKAADKWASEARAVAQLAQRAVAERWQVSDAGRGWRDARWSDVCALLPTRTNLRRLERAFEHLGVPYRMESGSLILNTQEVRDLLSCLRAIDDPSNQVALVAALRSPAYGCSDVDLVRWLDGGGRLDYEHPYRASAATGQQASATRGAEPEAILVHNPVARAFASLASFHAAQVSRSAAGTIDAFIRERCLAVQAFGHARPRDAWRRLRYVSAQARRLAASGQPTLRAVLDWLEGLQSEAFYDPESPVPDGDENAIRLLTVHAAKGLEFPIVLLTGLGGAPRRRGAIELAADRRASTLEVYCGSKFQTAGYDDTHQRAMHEAEQVRLLYVAATRARDHLVLCLFHGKEQSPAKRILQRLSDRPDLCRELVLTEDKPTAPAPPDEEARRLIADQTPEEHAEAERQWLEHRLDSIARLASQPRCTPSALAHGSPRRRATPPSGIVSMDADGASEAAPIDDEAEEPAGGEQAALAELHRGRGATALGRAVHAVLQAVDLEDLASLDQLARRMAHAYGLGEHQDKVRRLAAAVAGSAAVQRARKADRVWREAPVGVDVDGVLLEGFIDLLCQHPDGSLTVIDYKTDLVDAGTVARRAAAYRLQGGAYALAVERASGGIVRSVEFVFAALDGRTFGYEGDQLRGIIAEAQARVK